MLSWKFLLTRPSGPLRIESAFATSDNAVVVERRSAVKFDFWVNSVKVNGVIS
jgi:hypothetical protein